MPFDNSYLWVMGGELQKHDAIDRAELAMVANLTVFDCPLKHRFTPGMYTREIFMPKDTIHTSKIHLTEHQFIVSEGACSVYNAENNETIVIVAPYHGITKPGARRVLFIHEDCRWTTIHPLPFVKGDENDLSEYEINDFVHHIENILLDNRVNVLLEQYQEDKKWHLQQ